MPALDVSFFDSRNSMLYWYPEISGLDVPTVETEFVDISGADSSFDIREGGVDMSQLLETLDEIPVTEIQQILQTFQTEKAHIRTDWKASRLAGGEGRTITEDPRVIHEEVLQLIDSMIMMEFPATELAVREWIDVAVVGGSYGSVVCPEVRFIIDEGSVLGGFVDVYPDDFDRSFSEAEQTAVLTDIEDRFQGDQSQLRGWAKEIAGQLDETGWSVDFIQADSGEWYITDMALYGLYWSEDKQRWHNISHVPSGKPYNLEENVPDELDQPE